MFVFKGFCLFSTSEILMYKDEHLREMKMMKHFKNIKNILKIENANQTLILIITSSNH